MNQRRTSSRGILWSTIVGGGGVFTVWGWLAMAPVCLTVLGAYDAASTAAERATGVALAAAVHLVTGVLIFAAALVERQVSRPTPRAVLVLTAAVLIGAARPLVMDAAQSLVGIPMYDGSMYTRIATNVVFTVVSLTLCGVVVYGLRRYRSVQTRLRRVEQALDEARRIDERDLGAIAQEFLQDAERAVAAALTPAHGEPFDAQRQAQALRALSRDVVRPLSHRLFEPTVSTDDGTTRDASPPKAAVIEPKAPLALRPSPTPVGLAPVLYMAVVLPALVSAAGPFAAVAIVGAGLLIGVLGDLTVGRLSPRRRGFEVWFGVITIGYVAVGAAIGLSSTVLGGLVGHDGPYLAVNLIAYPLVGAATALGSSVASGLRETEAKLARALAENDRLTAHARTRLVAAREHAARILHSDVQGELIATALKLQRGLAGSGDVDSSRDKILELLRHGRGAAANSPEAVRESTLRVVTAWSSAIELDFVATAGVWERLSADSVLSEVTLDALSEALSNVVRHASAPRARARLYVLRDAPASVRLRVCSPGTLSPQGSTAGERTFGLADLARRAGHVTLREQESEVVLTVTFT